MAENLLTDAQVQALNQQLANDPEYRRLMALTQNPTAYAQALRSGQDLVSPIWQYLAQKYQLPIRPQGRSGSQAPYGWKIDASGQIVRDHDARNTALTAAAIVGGGYGASFLPGMGLTGGAATSGAAPAAAATTAAPTTAAAGAGTGGLSGIIGKIASNPMAQKALGLGAGYLGAQALGMGGGSDAPAPSAASPELQQLLATAMKRVSDQEGLFQATNRQAFQGLPDYVKRG